MKAKLIKTSRGKYLLLEPSKDIKEGWKPSLLGSLSLKNCQAIERGYDLDELAYDFSWNHQSDPNYGDTINIFKQGFQKALEILSDKKFTEDDVLKVVTHVLNKLVLVEGFDKQFLFPESIYQEVTSKCKSLQKTEWDVEIETVTRMDNGKCGLDAPTEKNNYDSDGCLILKKI